MKNNPLLTRQDKTRIKAFHVSIGWLLVASWIGSAHGFVISHTGSADPTTEGFTLDGRGCCTTLESLPNDMGHAAWSVAGIAQNSQALYFSGPLSTAQRTDISSQGFVLTANIRVLQGAAPVYNPVSPFVTISAQLDTGFRRFDMHFGVEANGDTVVVLPTSFDLSGGTVAQAFGPNFTLTGLGSSYHNYRLAFDPLTQSANLSVDGVERLQNYAGNTSYLENVGVRWGASGGGQGNFTSVQPVSYTHLTLPTSDLV